MHVAGGDHVGAEAGVGATVAGSRVADRVTRIIGITRGCLTRLVRPTADLVLPVPMVIIARPDHQGDIPTVTRTEGSGEIGTGMQAVARRGRLYTRAGERGDRVAG